MKKISAIVCFLSVYLLGYSQIHVRTLNESIRTLRVMPNRAFLVLDKELIDGGEEGNVLEISFDEMSHDVHQYTYTVSHWSADWSRESALNSGEYLRGFTTRDIADFEHSINTSREYTHYWFTFPNEDMLITRSGNYRLYIYEDGDPEKRVAEVDFCVVEPLTRIETKVRTNTDIEFNGRFQQVDIDISTLDLQMNDPNEIKIVVRQNNRTDNEVWPTHATFVEPKRLRYVNNKELIFEGGNEYHHFDAFSCFYAGVGIDRVFHENGDYQVLLFADEVLRGEYLHQYDSDGRFIVNAERTSDSDTEAEYMWVHWTLPMENPFFDGALYVGGDLFGNEMSLRNRLQYDNESRCYWLTTLVKQGGYDYQYWFVQKNQEPRVRNLGLQPKTTTQRVDGSYWQTENEYAIYVYWRPFGARYDRLVGVQILHSGQ